MEEAGKEKRGADDSWNGGWKYKVARIVEEENKERPSIVHWTRAGRLSRLESIKFRKGEG